MSDNHIPDATKMINNDQSIRQQRTPIYGDFRDNMENIAMIWTGILRASCPDITVSAKDVSLMFAAAKIVRAAGDKPRHQDNYVDGIEYLKGAEEISEKGAR